MKCSDTFPTILIFAWKNNDFHSTSEDTLASKSPLLPPPIAHLPATCCLLTTCTPDMPCPDKIWWPAHICFVDLATGGTDHVIISLVHCGLQWKPFFVDRYWSPGIFCAVSKLALMATLIFYSAWPSRFSIQCCLQETWSNCSSGTIIMPHGCDAPNPWHATIWWRRQQRQWQIQRP